MSRQPARRRFLHVSATRSLLIGALLSLLAALLATAPAFTRSKERETKPPYPPSQVIKRITWHWQTHRTAAPGSDLWPVTWGMDDNLYTAWGDGGGFGGTDQDGRVALGFARIQGEPERFFSVPLSSLLSSLLESYWVHFGRRAQDFLV